MKKEERIQYVVQRPAPSLCHHAGKFPLVSMGAERRVKRAQTRERGPHRRQRKFYLWCLRHPENNLLLSNLKFIHSFCEGKLQWKHFSLFLLLIFKECPCCECSLRQIPMQNPWIQERGNWRLGKWLCWSQYLVYDIHGSNWKYRGED